MANGLVFLNFKFIITKRKLKIQVADREERRPETDENQGFYASAVFGGRRSRPAAGINPACGRGGAFTAERLMSAAASATEKNGMEIGKKIREIRILNGLTQEELADRSELSKGFISQLENDLTSPSISTLEDILQCLGMSLNEFFSMEDTKTQIVFGDDDFFEKVDDQLKNKTEWIIPNAQKNIMEPIRLTLEPGGETYPDNPHEGEEFGYVLKGEITIIIGKEKHKAKAGEAFYYTPGKKHYIISKKGAEILWVSTPPSF